MFQICERDVAEIPRNSLIIFAEPICKQIRPGRKMVLCSVQVPC